MLRVHRISAEKRDAGRMKNRLRALKQTLIGNIFLIDFNAIWDPGTTNMGKGVKHFGGYHPTVHLVTDVSPTSGWYVYKGEEYYNEPLITLKSLDTYDTIDVPLPYFYKILQTHISYPDAVQVVVEYRLKRIQESDKGLGISQRRIAKQRTTRRKRLSRVPSRSARK